MDDKIIIKETIKEVKNHEGHYDVPTGYNSHLDYWQKGTGMKAQKCSNLNCNNKNNLIGGHVDCDNHVYITPICQDCNNQGSSYHFPVDEENLLKIK